MPAPSSPAHVVLIDGENVPEVDAGLFGHESVRFILLFGANQSKMKVELVERLVEHAAAVKLIRLGSSGKNALDFALAYYLGQAAASDPGAHYHLVSKDGGYDPLVKHLQSRGLAVQRHAGNDSLPFLKRPPVKAAAKTPANAADMFAITVERLKNHVKNRPKKKKGLLGTLTNYLGKTPVMTPEALLERLIRAGHVSIGEKEELCYRFEEA